ncbi:lytic transglycosylase domain-containing protein [Micromonospora sp. LAH09]|uniref:lytic transglycosylase domain-containing protein n=1 Tax=Micromonospora cabrerizensis TaxID=2911213 RepID=UPI001EE80790|nr:lytic transglycosylase domain-containing protein [Micromonospora cabrerizensis]MCG5467285.1 lytic transglycosylase domain-containing protein [Micromonospora cabrerizensis]
MVRRTKRLGTAVLAGFLVVSALVGCAAKGESPQGVSAPVAVTDAPTDAPADEATGEPSPSVSAVESMGAAPSSSATPTKKPTKKPTRTAPKPLAVAKPPTETQVPPAPPKPAPSSCKPTYKGTQASRAEVKAALTDAAGRTYWPTSAPDIKVPLTLLKATAWQESGWQSNIYACDGGVGLMQVMPGTATWMNQRFEKSYEIDAYRDNAYLGATYLAWATKYIGDMYFESDYRLDPALCTAELNSCLINAVIAAYNFGHGAVAQEGKPLAIPNPSYVRNVRALMTECVCLDY